MFIPRLVVAGTSFVSAVHPSKAFTQFVADRSLMLSFAGSHLDDGGFVEWLSQTWAAFSSWLSQPHILAVIIAWAATFTVVCIIIFGLGFGPIGVGTATLAAAFQSCMYGGFTPAGGVFATLTSMAMLGTLMPAAVGVASLIATIVASFVWVGGVGR